MILWMITSTITAGPSSTELVCILTDQICIQTNAPESAESLYRAYTNVLNTLKAHEEIFKRFNASVHPDLVKKWEEVDNTPRRDPVTKKVISVHEAKFKTSQCLVILLLLINVLILFSPSMQKKVYQALLKQEVNNKLAGLESGCGFTQLINNALHLEHDQYIVG
jgi:hypothetical protein